MNDDDDDCIKLWRWQDAPDDYKKLSQHGGDEDWILLCPRDLKYCSWPLGLDGAICEGEYATGFGLADLHTLRNGDSLVIFAHA